MILIIKTATSLLFLLLSYYCCYCHIPAHYSVCVQPHLDIYFLSKPLDTHKYAFFFFTLNMLTNFAYLKNMYCISRLFMGDGWLWRERERERETLFVKKYFSVLWLFHPNVSIYTADWAQQSQQFEFHLCMKISNNDSFKCESEHLLFYVSIMKRTKVKVVVSI